MVRAVGRGDGVTDAEALMRLECSEEDQDEDAFREAVTLGAAALRVKGQLVEALEDVEISSGHGVRSVGAPGATIARLAMSAPPSRPPRRHHERRAQQ